MSIHEVFPYICVKDATQAALFYAKAFGAKEKYRLADPSGRVGHMEIQLGSTTLMVAEEFPEYGYRSPDPSLGRAFMLHLHVDDADAMIQRAVEAGATVVRPTQDQFYGERSGTIRDPFGHEWNIGHHLEDVTPDEMQRRYIEVMKSGG